MKKKLNVRGLDCAKCAADFENAINNIDGIKSASVSFITEKVSLEIDDRADYDKILKQILKVGKKIEPDMELTEKH